ENQLQQRTIDFAIHSLKDVQPNLPDGLELTVFPEQEDRRDAYLANNHIPFRELPQGAVIGTCSIRRAAQLLRWRSDLHIKPIRGPIDDRIRQMQAGDYDAIILAVAGIKRLGIGEDVITEYFSLDDYVPALGQGTLAIESRVEDTSLHAVLRQLN